MRLSILALSLASVGCAAAEVDCYRLAPDGTELACDAPLALPIDTAKVVSAPPGAGEAAQAIADVYGLTSLPLVYWYGRNLDCGEGTGFISLLNGTCFRGEELGGVISLVVPPPGGRISEPGSCGALPHEMAHFASEQAGEGGCGDHTCRWFHGPCQAATARVVEMGL
jgi:hypothetical protein